MAAYIDLNPVRAGLVHDPKEYRWSGYGEAMASQAEAQAGLRWFSQHMNAEGLAPAASESTPMESVLALYRQQLYSKGREVRDANGTMVKRGFSEEEIQAEIQAGGRLPMAAFLRLRVRYFTDGAVIGTTAFVEAVFQAHRDRFSANRQTGSRRLQRLELESPLRVARALAVEAVR